MSNTVQADSLIRWHYQLYLADGYLVEASEDPQGEILQLGAGAFHPNIEAALVGLPVGEPIRLVIMASEAFGLPDSDAVQTLPLSDFPTGGIGKLRFIIETLFSLAVKGFKVSQLRSNTTHPTVLFRHTHHVRN